MADTKTKTMCKDKLVSHPQYLQDQTTIRPVAGQIERIITNYIRSPEETKQQHIAYLLSKGHHGK